MVGATRPSAITGPPRNIEGASKDHKILILILGILIVIVIIIVQWIDPALLACLMLPCLLVVEPFLLLSSRLLPCENKTNKIKGPERKEDTEEKEDSPDLVDRWPRTPPQF